MKAVDYGRRNMGYGYWGKVLRVDLSSGRIDVETPDPIIYRRYLGGSAFGLHYLLKELKPGIDPLSPENMIIFTTVSYTHLTLPTKA